MKGLNHYLKIFVLLLSALAITVGGKAETADSALIADTAQAKTSFMDFRPKVSRFVLPAALIGVGAVGSAVDGWKDYHLFTRKDSVDRIHLDDYLEWGMLGWTFACDLVGKEKHNWGDQLAITFIAEVLNVGMTRGCKVFFNEQRPDGGNYSFPSGHTANVFLGAQIAFHEFKDTNMALACSGYLIAAFTAGSRIYNNRHWVSDVIAGAGFGILSTELAYLIYCPIRDSIARKNSRLAQHLTAMPMLGSDCKGVLVAWRF